MVFVLRISYWVRYWGCYICFSSSIGYFQWASTCKPLFFACRKIGADGAVTAHTRWGASPGNVACRWFLTCIISSAVTKTAKGKQRDYFSCGLLMAYSCTTLSCWIWMCWAHNPFSLCASFKDIIMFSLIAISLSWIATGFCIFSM